MEALVLGAGGQDGQLLTKLLLQGGDSVTGVTRTERNGLPLAQGQNEIWVADVSDASIVKGVLAAKPFGVVFNMAAASSVAASWAHPGQNLQLNLVAVAGLLEGIRSLPAARRPRLLQASSSEMFGCPHVSPQDEMTPLLPTNPYGVGKAAAHQLVIAYRQAYGLHCSSAILYNHESPLRPPHFVSRKITRAAAAISLGLQRELVLGDLDVSRDWGYAGDYVKAMVAMMSAEVPDDYVIATGVSHTVRELVATAFSYAGVPNWKAYVKSDPQFIRPREIYASVGDASKAKRVLGWEPTVTFEEMIAEMVEADLADLRARTQLEG